MRCCLFVLFIIDRLVRSSEPSAKGFVALLTAVVLLLLCPLPYQ